MAAIWGTGFEINSNTQGVEFDSVTGTISIQTGTVAPGLGTRAMQVNTTSTTAFVRERLYTSNQSIVIFQGIRLYISSLPSANVQILRYSNSSNSTVGHITLTTTGTLRLSGANGAQIGSDSSSLSTSTWYYVELKLDASANPGSLDAHLNGSSFASGANSSQGSFDRVLAGIISPSVTANLIFDDWYVNSNTTSVNNGFMGTWAMFQLYPNGAGDNTQWTKNVGSTNYACVNINPPGDSTTFISDNTTGHIDDYTLPASGLHSYDTVNWAAVGMRFQCPTPNGCQIQARFKITSGGTVTTGTTVTPTNSTWSTNNSSNPFIEQLITAVQPGTSNPLTQSNIDSAQIGIKDTSASNTTDVDGMWLLVSYTPGTAPASGSLLASLGVG